MIRFFPSISHLEDLKQLITRNGTGNLEMLKLKKCKITDLDS